MNSLDLDMCPDGAGYAAGEFVGASNIVLPT